MNNRGSDFRGEAGEQRQRSSNDGRFSRDRRPQRTPRSDRSQRPHPSSDDRRGGAYPPRAPREEEGVRSGPHSVQALLEERPAQVNRLLFVLNSGSPRLYELQKQAEALRIPCQQLPESKMRRYSLHHQGVVALCHARPLDDWEEVKGRLSQLDSGFVVLLAGIEDPHNLGACARSALALGAEAVLLPQRGGCGLTETAMRASAGALERISVCRPPILDAAVLELKELGWRVVRLWEGATERVHELAPAAKTLLIVGGEDEGVPPYLRKVSDIAAKLPMDAAANSYNASVALSLALYELARQHGFPADGVVEGEPVSGDELERDLLDF